MRMNLKRKSVLAAVALAALAAPITSTAREDRDDVTTYRARLTGFGEVPPKLANGQGKFSGALSADGASISWTLSWTDLTTPAQAAHIHFGQPQNTGSVVVFFCGGGGRDGCPDGPGHSGSVSGTAVVPRSFCRAALAIRRMESPPGCPRTIRTGCSMISSRSPSSATTRSKYT